MKPRTARCLLGAAAATTAGMAGVWVWANDLSLPAVDPCRYRRVMAVFPHPDDETVGCGGTLHRVAGCGCHVTLVVLTRGESGGGPAARGPALAVRRSQEMRLAADHLRVGRLVQMGLPDGGLQDRVPELKCALAAAMRSDAPDLVITYDPSGMYGHTDHVTCSLVVAELTRVIVPAADLWYVAVPGRLRALLVRAGSLPAASSLPHAPLPAQVRVGIRGSVRAKGRAWRAHQSQQGAIGGALGALVPGWTLVWLSPYEYFHRGPARSAAGPEL